MKIAKCQSWRQTKKQESRQISNMKLRERDLENTYAVEKREKFRIKQKDEQTWRQKDTGKQEKKEPTSQVWKMKNMGGGRGVDNMKWTSLPKLE